MRNTTGTLVHGKKPSSVTTAVTKSGGVTSYNKFKGVTLLPSFQLESELFSVTLRNTN